MRRLFWLAMGITIGALVVRKVSRAAERMTPAGIGASVAERLRELGHTVLEAEDGPGALQILASSRPDLLITDVGLPHGMNGRQLAEAARDQAPELSVLFITGYAGGALPPGVEVIGKPFELDTLARRVQALLEGGSPANDRNPDP